MITDLYPLIAASMATEAPVFPEEAAIKVDLAFNYPLASALSIMWFIILSLWDNPGFKNSAFPNTCIFFPCLLGLDIKWVRSNKGVFPIISTNFGCF